MKEYSEVGNFVGIDPDRALPPSQLTEEAVVAKRKKRRTRELLFLASEYPITDEEINVKRDGFIGFTDEQIRLALSQEKADQDYSNKLFNEHPEARYTYDPATKTSSWGGMKYLPKKRVE